METKGRMIVLAGVFLAFLFSGAAAAQQQTPPSFADLAEKVRPSVVNISATTAVQTEERLPFGQDDPLREFFERFFGPRQPREYRQRGLGSGFVIESSGFILTNNHVVARAQDIQVVLNNKRTYKANVVGRDPMTDIALIKIEPEEPLQPLSMGNSDELRVGDWVLAIGNPFGLESTVTSGIVSAKYRRIGVGAYDDFIQTDASINPGNSGGPLVNAEGLVVGINTAIFTPTGGNIGIGFAIPINMARDLLPQLRTGRVVRGWLGVSIQEVTPALAQKLGIGEPRGALVAEVTAGSPAERAGIRQGDVIIAFGGEQIETANDLPILVASTSVGEKVGMEVQRGSNRMRLQVEIGELAGNGETPVEEQTEQGPRLGMSVQEINPELARRHNLAVNRGIIVVEVAPNSPAALSGIRPGDVILEMDREPVEGLAAFRNKVGQYKSGDTMLLLVRREGSNLFVTVELG